MIRCFLSHSGADKGSYVDVVARKLGEAKCVYDLFDFRSGEKTLDEILFGLDLSSVFVLFISENSLNSDWVKKEILFAKNMYENNKINKIYPIIIDKKITYKDSRIPDWMRNEYNLRYVSRPVVAARRIEQFLMEMAWWKHPGNKEKSLVFVGRNEIIDNIEERIDDHSKISPVCIVASGLRRVGRKSCLRSGLIKTGVFMDSYSPPLISLTKHESIEDFINKINDLGVCDPVYVYDMMDRELKDKIDLACRLVLDLKVVDEVLFIDDDRCIVQDDRSICDWFVQILKKLPQDAEVRLCVASSNRMMPGVYGGLGDKVFGIIVNEMSPSERRRLFKRYLDVYGVELGSQDFDFFCNLFVGYPEQVGFTVNLIKDVGVGMARNKSNLISKYNTDRVAQLIKVIERDSDYIDFLSLLCRFEFVSLKFLIEITEDERLTMDRVSDLIGYSMCDLIGANGEYVRTNDIVREYVLRGRVAMPQRYQDKLRDHLDDYLSRYREEEFDFSDTLFSLKECIKRGSKVETKFLVPSHFLKTMKEIYDTRKSMKDVVVLADSILAKSSNFDIAIVKEIRYFLCLALAREKSTRCLKEVQNISGPEHNFILGFYYNQVRRYSESIESLRTAISMRPGYHSAKHQLSQVYITIEEFDKAENISRELYEYDSSNPYFIHGYINCLIHRHIDADEKSMVERMIEQFSDISHSQAREMQLSTRSLYLAYCKNSEYESISYIDDAVNSYPDAHYPIINKFKIGLHFSNLECMEEAIQMMKGRFDNGPYHFSYVKSKALFYAANGNKDKAVSLVNVELRSLPEESRSKIIAKIEKIVTRINVSK